MTKTRDISESPKVRFDRVTIIGVGLLGASLGLAMKARGLATCVVGVGRAHSPSLAVALDKHAIDEAQTDAALAVKDSDLVVLCTPVRQFPDMLRSIAPALRPGTIVTDVGSTKQQVMRWAADLLPEHVNFIGSHPMAGSEKRGPEFARADLYDGAVCLICPQDVEPVGRVVELWQRIGMRTMVLSPHLHDLWVAAVSHLPHAAAFSLVNAAALVPEALPVAAGGFIDSTRVASSDVQMWTDIFLTNQDEVVAMMDSYIEVLKTLRDAIRQGNEEYIHNHLTNAKEKRDALIRNRSAAKESKA
jgi:prephenate dehydrogenase